jgi:MYXO-CTERM domain-containing protein
MRRTSRPWPKLAALCTAFALLLASGTALAFGNIILKTPNPKEEDGRWQLVFDIDYGKVPDMPHVPMMFSFKHVTQYEWSLTDQSPEKPVFTKKPLTGQTDINLPQDVGFADASGKIWKMTKGYKLELRRRDADFEAGEYELTVRLEQGGIVGRPMRIVLGGKNDPVDRRAVNISAPRPPDKKKTDQKEGEEGKGGGDATSKAEDPFAGLPSGDGEPADAAGPPAEKPKQGGCGCRLEGRDEGHGDVGRWGLALGGLGLASLRRRRPRRG